ncbi:putative EG45-like domain containing protein 1 isoform X1 [Corylus avellana]|uniref:putative EG45-like domain containing protein 1 isoform X1 n=1 Tax=Corylus avellana TaxID=13451 RepID=UPI00286CD124|nr:putative EG45-like domain containing protein 1 isoform X1 [Corylus avellana]
MLKLAKEMFAMEGAQSCHNANVKRVPSSPEEDGTLKNCLETFGTGQNQMFSLRKAGSSPQPFYRCLILLLLLVNLAPLSNGDVGTAAQYEAPFSPTACYGTNEAQFLSSEEFGSAGKAIWDNGEACGRLYEVQCISGPDPTTCIPGQIIQVRIVDHALTSVSRPSWDDATMVLSTTAFGKISNASATFINIQYIPA